MGISGLTSFIDKNPHLLHKHELKETAVVIDGNNLFHYIHLAYRLSSLFGGDYDMYRKKVFVNLKSLLKCNIKPYVVFDGAYTPDNRKLDKCIDKAKQRIRNARIATKFGRCSMTPLLARETFVQTLDELNIPHVTCQFEADNEIAKLANKLKCPVISNDSDFYIFDLLYGFLPLDYIDFTPLVRKNEDGSKSTFLHCRKYQVVDFIDSFEGLNRSVLPVFASLLGNDYVLPSHVQKVFIKVQSSIKLTKGSEKVVKLIHWLEKHNDKTDNILESIIPHIKKKRKFLDSVLGYYDVMNFEGCDLLKYFSKNRRKQFVPSAGSHFLGYNGNPFPSWFLLSICKGEITPLIMNSAVLRRVIFLAQAEHLSSPTAYQCCEFVRQIIYGILLQSDPAGETYKPFEAESLDYLEKLVRANLKRKEYDKILEEIIIDTGKVNHNSTDVVETHKDYELDCEEESSDQDREARPEDGDDNDKQEIHLTDEEVEKGYFESGESDFSRSCKENPQPHILKQTLIQEYQRQEGMIKKVYVKPALLAGGDPLPTLSDIGRLTQEKRLSILLAALEVDSCIVKQFTPNLALYAVSIIVWIKHANPSVTEYHLDCIILCSILIQMQNVGSGIKKKSKIKKQTTLDEGETDNQEGSMDHACIDIEEVCEGGRKSDKFNKVLDNLEKYHSTKREYSRRNQIDMKITHPYIQLECCINEVSSLNKLLRFPLLDIRPAYHINGTFLYSFYLDLMTKSSPYGFIEGLLLAGSDIFKLFCQFKAAILNAQTGNFFRVLGDGVKKKPKKKKKKKHSNCEDGGEEKKEEDCLSNGQESESEKEFNSISGFDVNNKFSLLMV